MSSPTLPTTSKVLRLLNPPEKDPVLVLGTPKSTFVLQSEPIPTLKHNEVLVQPIFISNDPAQRSWIQKDADEKRTYRPPVKKGEVMAALAICKVISSKSDSIKAGSLVNGFVGWSEYAVVDAKELQPVIPIPGVSPSIFIGAFGIPGLTAYLGLTDVLKLQKGQSIVVSGAAGAVGNIAVQYAKHVIGAKVIAIAGSKEKCDWVSSLGADVVLNYKDESFFHDLDVSTEGFVDAYFDNGAILDHMLTRVKSFGRIAACGAISIYNDKTSTKLANYSEIITNRLTIQGFIVLDSLDRAPEAVNALSAAVKEGKLNVTGSETLVKAKFEDVPEVWGKLFVGGNTGKLVTQVAEI